MKNPEWERMLDEAIVALQSAFNAVITSNHKPMTEEQLRIYEYGAEDGANWAKSHFEQKLEAAKNELAEHRAGISHELFDSVCAERDLALDAIAKETAAREAAEKRVQELDKALRLALPYVERDIIAAVKENFGFVSNDSWANKSCDDRDLIVNTLEGRNE
jgi:uncharacterized membrane protein